jgi:ATP/maltotriose-dependent transcriptional regulator MalT/two-component SAPR family response regulator
MILETKLQPPSLKPNTLRRERLLKLLKNHLERKLILVTGDAGYGKTTLLAQVMKEEDMPCVYYDLDRGDSDLVVFASYIVHGLERIQSGLASRVNGLLEQGGEVGKNYELLFGTLINELVEKRKEELFIILDDYHFLDERSAVHQGLDYFIDHLPEKIHVVIASRFPPPLSSLAKWRAKEDLFEIARGALLFTDEEVRALLGEVYRIAISPEELKQVAEQTEGWITGIRLILQSAGKDGKTIKDTLNGYLEANQPLFEYFANEIVASEPLNVQDFLRKSSILDTMTPEACDSILGKKDAVELLKEYGVSPASGVSGSEPLLKDLEKRNLFLAQVGGGEYKYHRLFRDFLQGQIKDESFGKALHLKAADYYQRKGQLEQVIEHYLEAGSFEWAGKGILQVADRLFDLARLGLLNSWLERLPQETFEPQPMLQVIQGKLLREQGRFAEAESRLREAAQRAKAQGDQDCLAKALVERAYSEWWSKPNREALKTTRKALAACPPSEEGLRASIFNLVGILWTGLSNYPKARAYYLKARGILLKTGKTPDPAGLLASVESNLAALLLRQGEARQAFQAWKVLIERTQNQYANGRGVHFAGAVRAALETGERGWAEWCLTQGRALCEPYEDLRSKAALEFASGLLDLDRGEWVLALEHLELAEGLFGKVGSREDVPVLRERARLHRLRGEYDQAEQCLERARVRWVEVGGSQKSLTGATLLAESAVLQAVRGDLKEAKETLKSVLALGRELGNKEVIFNGFLGESQRLFSQGKEAGARRLFLRAVAMAQSQGYEGTLSQELRHSPRLRALAQTAIPRKESGRSRDKQGTPIPLLQGILQRLPTAPGRELPREEKTSLEISLFGVLEIALPHGTRVPVRWYSRKTASLFAYLLLHRDRICNREELIEALWPRAGLKQAEQNLYNCVSQLKKNLASGFRRSKEAAFSRTPFIVHQERGYRIAPTLTIRLDVEGFKEEEEKARVFAKEGNLEGSQKSYGRCLELYRDRFLANLGERWCEEQREEFEKSFLLCLKEMAAYRLAKKDYEKAISLYRRYLAREFLSEEVHRAFWKALKAVNQDVDIRKDYKELRKILKRDLGEDLKPETEEVYKNLTSS